MVDTTVETPEAEATEPAVEETKELTVEEALAALVGKLDKWNHLNLARGEMKEDIDNAKRVLAA